MYSFVACVFLDNVYFKLFLYSMFLVAIPGTLLGEVEVHSISLNLWRATHWSSGICCLDWWCPTCQFIVSVLSSLFSVSDVGGAACHGLVPLLLVPREPCDLRLRVEMVVFPTNPPPGVQGGVDIYPTECVSAQKQDFHALRVPRSCGESVLCA